MVAVECALEVLSAREFRRLLTVVMLMGILTGPGFRFPVCFMGIWGANTSCI